MAIQVITMPWNGRSRCRGTGDHDAPIWPITMPWRVHVDASTRGCGKGLAVDVVSIIATGKPAARTVYSDSDDELAKVITTLAAQGVDFVLFDNIDGVLGSASLDAALTSIRWSGRRLGRSEMVDVPLKVTWMATGNNVVLGADTARRTLHIRLESRLEHPEDRADFEHRDLLAHVASARSEYVCAALTILSAYCTAGKPAVDLPPWGSYEGWSAIVRAAIVWVGLPDPLLAREALRTRADSEASALRVIVETVATLDPHRSGLKTREIQDWLNALGRMAKALDGRTTEAELDAECAARQRFREAVDEFIRPRVPGDLPSAKQLGKLFSKFRGRVVSTPGGLLALDSRDEDGTMKWTAKPAG